MFLLNNLGTDTNYALRCNLKYPAPTHHPNFQHWAYSKLNVTIETKKSQNTLLLFRFYEELLRITSYFKRIISHLRIWIILKVQFANCLIRIIPNLHPESFWFKLNALLSLTKSEFRWVIFTKNTSNLKINELSIKKQNTKT